MLELEPKLSPDALGGLYAPGGGIVEPYRFVFSLVEVRGQRTASRFFANWERRSRAQRVAARGGEVLARRVLGRSRPRARATW